MRRRIQYVLQITRGIEMPLFPRIHDRLIKRALKHKYQTMDAGPERDAVAHAIAGTSGDRDSLMAEAESSGIAAPPANGILAQLIQWLEQNWQQILAAILKLFGK